MRIARNRLVCGGLFLALCLVQAPAPVAGASGLPPTTPSAGTVIPRAWLPLLSRTMSIVPDDPLYTVQWAPALVGAPLAWPLSSGNGKTIAFIDTGVDLNHPDLAGKILPGQHFYHDANGQSQQDDNVQDDNGHGTEVTGVAAAIGNNGVGIAGMAWQAQILPVKVVDSSGWFYYDSDMASGIQWAVDQGAKVINISHGGQIASRAVGTATDYAYAQGALVIAAAGNCGGSNYADNGCTTQNPPYFPAAFPNVMAVAATDANDQPAYFSESGGWISVAAPGVDILSTMWIGPNFSTYAASSGTSFSAPMVSGLAALVWSRNPALTNAQVASVIANSAVDLGAPGFDPAYGYGRIDASAAVMAATASNMQQPAAVRPTVRAAQSTSNAQQPVRPGAVLVRLTPSAQATGVGPALWARYGVQATEALHGLGVQVLSVPPGQERQLAAALQADPAVEFAEPDYQVRLVP
jgi:thermitase